MFVGGYQPEIGVFTVISQQKSGFFWHPKPLDIDNHQGHRLKRVGYLKIVMELDSLILL